MFWKYFRFVGIGVVVVGTLFVAIVENTSNSTGNNSQVQQPAQQTQPAKRFMTN